MAVDSTSMGAKELVSSREMTAGVTNVAAMSVTPRTFMVASTAKLMVSMRPASMRPLRTPLTSATSGSKVRNSSGR